jgi:hypothetical protein
MRVLGGGAESELVQICLADHDGAGAVQPSHHLRVLVCDTLGVKARSKCRALARSVDVVLYGDDAAGERAHGVARFEASLEFMGTPACVVGHDGDERIQSGVGPLDILQVPFRVAEN